MIQVHPNIPRSLKIVLIYFLAASGWVAISVWVIAPILAGATTAGWLTFVREWLVVPGSALLLCRLLRQDEPGTRDSRNSLTALLASTHEETDAGVAIFDRDGFVRYLNPAFERFTGYVRSETTGRDLPGLLADSSNPELLQLMLAALGREDTPSSRLAITADHGRLGEFEVKISPLRRVTTEVTHYFVVIREVTREVLLEKQLREAQKMEAIGALAGGIAHDFNNILGTVISCTEMALDDTPKESPIREDLEHVLKAGRRGKSLIRQILTFTRTSEQKLEPTQMEPVVKEGLKMLRSALPANLEIRQVFACRQSLVLADAIQIHQILMNLCTNAAHAMGAKGGLLEVILDEVEIDRQTEATSGNLQAGPYVRLTVRDTGHGMRREVLERIFDPLFTTKEQGTGTGLGLPVVHGIVTSHHGAVKVESEPGKGTVFRVYLPRVEPEGNFLEDDRPPSVPGGRERILLIDDEEDLVYAGVKMLRRLGYEVVGCSTPAEALALFQAHPERFDLVISDQSMPKMTGTELAKAILNLRPGFPIIICTGFSPDSGEGITQKQAEAVGIREVHLKPLERFETAAAIRRVLDGHA